uniref:Cyclin-like domain-containing protein n=1 Tax=Physcomitrium patens TaxID=3218 RepID=A0A2K1L2W2_PHYPA|nr:hypothetical protein PHYPA_003161 [Physcomitrium patens]
MTWRPPRWHRIRPSGLPSSHRNPSQLEKVTVGRKKAKDQKVKFGGSEVEVLARWGCGGWRSDWLRSDSGMERAVRGLGGRRGSVGDSVGSVLLFFGIKKLGRRNRRLFYLAAALSKFCQGEVYVVEGKRVKACILLLCAMACSLSDMSAQSALVGATFSVNGRLEEPDYSKIEKFSPSRLDGVDLKKETYFRKKYYIFLQDLGMRLKVPQVTIATAIVFCHRFFHRQSHAKNDRLIIATACMFLAGKVEETHRPIREVIVFSYHIRFRIDPLAKERIEQKEVIEEQKELVLAGERLVLTTLGFDLNIHHPYKPLVAAIKRFKAQKTLAQVAWNFVNDSLRTSLCLQFKPHHIAAGAIFLAAKFLKVNLPEEGDKIIYFSTKPSLILVLISISFLKSFAEVSNQMLELYEQNRTNGATGPLANELSPSELDRGHAPVSSIQAPSANGNRHQQSVSGIFQPVETNANEVSSCEVEDNTVGTLRSSSTPNQSSNARRKCTPEPPGGQNLNGDEAGDNC